MSTEKRSSSATIVLARITEALRDLADVDFQRRVWIEGSKAEVSSPAEVFSALFDDSGLRDALSRKQQVFSAGIDARLAAFDRRLKPIVTRLYFLDLIDLAKEIEGAEWSAVRAEASLLLEDMSRSGVI